MRTERRGFDLQPHLGLKRQEVMARLLAAGRHHPEPGFHFGRFRLASVALECGSTQRHPQPLVLGAQRLELLRHKAVTGLQSRRNLLDRMQPGELKYVELVRRL